MKSGYAIIFLLSDLYNNSIAYSLDIVKPPRIFLLSALDKRRAACYTIAVKSVWIFLRKHSFFAIHHKWCMAIFLRRSKNGTAEKETNRTIQ